LKPIIFAGEKTFSKIHFGSSTEELPRNGKIASISFSKAKKGKMLEGF
jgi:hypothetical protein